MLETLIEVAVIDELTKNESLLNEDGSDIQETSSGYYNPYSGEFHGSVDFNPYG